MLGCPCSPALITPLSLPTVVSGDEPREKIDLVTYFGKRPPGVLHCTTKFCDYGKAAGADDYAQQDVSAPQGHRLRWGRGRVLEVGTRVIIQYQKPHSSSRKMTSAAPAHPSGSLAAQTSGALSGEPGLHIHPQTRPAVLFLPENAVGNRFLLWPL